MNLIGVKPKKQVFFPEQLFHQHYVGELRGAFFAAPKIFNVIAESAISDDYSIIGEIYENSPPDNMIERLVGWWDDGTLHFRYDHEQYEVKFYNLYQNIFSRNTGILESDIMQDKCAIILGCGSVGSLVALELARSGVGKFVLVDNDVLEYHNLCRHQCAIHEVGSYKVDALKKRILDINPAAITEAVVSTVELIDRPLFDKYCVPNKSIIIGCADNRAADVYANSLAVLYHIPFISVGFWERAFAGEIFYYLPDMNMPCYKCALGDGVLSDQRTSANRRLYTTQEDLASAHFEPGISVDINFVTTIGIKLVLDILNRDNEQFTPRLLPSLKQYTLVCNTNNPLIGGEMAEIFSYPLQVTTSLEVGFGASCPPCEFE